MSFTACERSEKTRSSGNESEAKQTSRKGKSDRMRNATPDSDRALFKAELAKAKSISDPEIRDKALVALAWKAMEGEMDGMEETLKEISFQSPDRMDLIETVATELANRDPDRAIVWVESLSLSEESEKAKNEVIQIIANTDPAKAARLVQKPSSAESDLNDLARHVVLRWTSENPNEAANWVASMPASGARNSAMRTVISEWAMQDPERTFSWISKQSDAVVNSEAIQIIEQAYVDLPDEIKDEWLKSANPGLQARLRDLTQQDTGETDSPPDSVEEQAPE